jgi:hypothetical protein
MDDKMFEQKRIISTSSLDDMAAQFKDFKRVSTNSMLDDMAAQFKDFKRVSTNSILDDMAEQFKEVKRFPTFLDGCGNSSFISIKTEYQKLVQSNRMAYDISKDIITQIELPLKNLQKLVQSNIIPNGISKNLISQIESLLKNPRQNSYNSYYSGTYKNYYRGRGTSSSTQSNDYQSREQNPSQAASKSQNKEQNSSQVTDKSKKGAASKNKVVKLRRGATAQFEVLDEINSRVINNNNNPVEMFIDSNVHRF